MIDGNSATNPKELLQIGRVLQVPDLLQPTKVVFHHGNGQHSCAFPESAVYQSVKKDISQWNFTDFSLAKFNEQQWAELLNQKKGIEIFLPLSTSVGFLSALFGVEGLSDFVQEINRIWIYVDPQTGLTHAIFLSDEKKKVVLAKTNMNLNNMNKYYFSFGEDWELPFYQPLEKKTYEKADTVYKEITYIPRDQQKLSSYKYFYIAITPQQGVKSLFGDSGMIHQVVDKDGTLYYTDGIRVLKFPPSLRYFDYFSPESVDGEKSPVDQLTVLQEMVSFINGHGGFGGDYQLERIDQNNYVFRERIGSFPLYGEKGIHQIYIRSDNGKVIAYKRPLVYLDTYFEKLPVTIQSSEELIETLKKRKLDKKLAGVELAYQTVMQNGYIEMVPVWVIRQDGSSSPILLQASVAQDGNEGGQ